MKRLLSITAMICTIAVMISSCDLKKETPLRIGLCSWPGYEPIALAQDRKLFGTAVKVIRYSTPHDAYKAFKNRAIDLVALTLDEIIKLSDVRLEPQIFLVTDISNGGDALAVKPSIQSIGDLKGKRIALESSVLAQYMLKRILDHAPDMKQTDLTIEILESGYHVEAYKENQADAFISYEPTLSALKKEGARVLFDSSMIANEIIDVVAAQKGVLRERHDEVVHFVSGWYAALDIIEKHPEDAYQAMAEFESVSMPSFRQSLSGLKLGTKDLNARLIKGREIRQSIHKLSDLMIQNGIINSNWHIDSLSLGDI